jgi:hypothetical protein
MVSTSDYRRLAFSWMLEALPSLQALRLRKAAK